MEEETRQIPHTSYIYILGQSLYKASYIRSERSLIPLTTFRSGRSSRKRVGPLKFLLQLLQLQTALM